MTIPELMRAATARAFIKPLRGSHTGCVRSPPTSRSRLDGCASPAMALLRNTVTYLITAPHRMRRDRIARNDVVAAVELCWDCFAAPRVDPRLQAHAFFEARFGLSTVRRDDLAGSPADEGMMFRRVWLSRVLPQSVRGDPYLTVCIMLRNECHCSCRFVAASPVFIVDRILRRNGRSGNWPGIGGSGHAHHGRRSPGSCRTGPAPSSCAGVAGRRAGGMRFVDRVPASAQKRSLATPPHIAGRVCYTARSFASNHPDAMIHASGGRFPGKY